MIKNFFKTFSVLFTIFFLLAFFSVLLGCPGPNPTPDPNDPSNAPNLEDEWLNLFFITGPSYPYMGPVVWITQNGTDVTLEIDEGIPMSLINESGSWYFRGSLEGEFSMNLVIHSNNKRMSGSAIIYDGGNPVNFHVESFRIERDIVPADVSGCIYVEMYPIEDGDSFAGICEVSQVGNALSVYESGQLKATGNLIKLGGKYGMEMLAGENLEETVVYAEFNDNVTATNWGYVFDLQNNNPPYGTVGTFYAEKTDCD